MTQLPIWDPECGRERMPWRSAAPAPGSAKRQHDINIYRTLHKTLSKTVKRRSNCGEDVSIRNKLCARRLPLTLHTKSLAARGALAGTLCIGPAYRSSRACQYSFQWTMRPRQAIAMTRPTLQGASWGNHAAGPIAIMKELPTHHRLFLRQCRITVPHISTTALHYL